MKLFKRHYLDKKGLPVIDAERKWQDILFWTVIITALFAVKTNITVFGTSLNLTVLVPFYFGLKKSPEKGLMIGVTVGLIEDSLSNTILGPNIISKGSIGILSSLLLGRFFVWTPLFGVLACFAITFFDSIIVYTCRELFFVQPALFKGAVVKMLVQSAFNAPIGYFIKPADE
jgi:rod shape-determining protein MreD